VDYDLGWAAMTAAVNAEEGVHATYFVLVASDLYNPASERGRTALAGIAGHGQSIGLHYHHRGGALDRQRLAHEFANLRHLVPRAEPIIAWHNPEGELAPLTLAAVDAGFVCTYESGFFGPDRYASDSNLRNSGATLAAFAGDCTAPLAQILLHPCNWVGEATGMDDVLKHTLRHHVDRLLGEFDSNRHWRKGLGAEICRSLATCPWYRDGGQ
jgi:hypothetical protein